MLTEAETRLLIEQWYRLFNRPNVADARRIHDLVTSNDYRSHTGDGKGESWDRETSIHVAESFGTSIPDLRFEIRDMIISGAQVVVRGEVSGTPARALFFGRIPLSGKSFEILAVDIHTLSEGKIQKTYHLENWFAAAQQLQVPVPPSAAGDGSEAMTEADLNDAHRRFDSALIGGDLKALDQLYASDYVVIRPNGQRLSKSEILADIAAHAVRFSSISSKSVQNRL